MISLLHYNYKFTSKSLFSRIIYNVENNVIGNWILLLKKKYFVLYIILKKSFSTE